MTEDKKRLLIDFQLRYRWLCVVEIIIIVLQVIGMIVCGGYVVINFVNYAIPDLYVGTKQFSFEFRMDYMNIICFVLSVLLAFSRPANLREQINTLKLAIKYLKQGEDKKATSFQVSIIEQANEYVTEIDKYIRKKKEKKKR